MSWVQMVGDSLLENDVSSVSTPHSQAKRKCHRKFDSVSPISGMTSNFSSLIKHR